MTCIVFTSSYLRITHIEDSKIDVWNLREGEASTVGIKGEVSYQPELRSSVSIKNKFNIAYKNDSDYMQYFTKIKIGIGSKHIYPVGGFMKEHYDTRLPDLDGRLPHIMTLVITNSISTFRVNGKKPYTRHTANFYSVLFSLNCPHERLPVKKETHSFVFPVYGVFNPGHSLKPVNSDSIFTVVQGALHDERLEIEQKQAYIDSLGDEELSCLFVKYMFFHEKEPDSSRRHGVEKEDVIPTAVQITYTDSENQTHTMEIVDDCETVTIPFGKNIKVTKKVMSDKNFVALIDKKIESLKQKAESAYLESLKSDIPEFKFDFTDKPDIFFIVLRGRYFYDTFEDSLTPYDKALYEYAKKAGKKVTLQHTTLSDGYLRDENNFPTYMEKDGKLEKVISMPSYEVSDVKIEFDDQGGYDSHYKLVYGALLVTN